MPSTKIKVGDLVKVVVPADQLRERGIVGALADEMAAAPSLEVTEVWEKSLWVRHPVVASSEFSLPHRFFQRTSPEVSE